MSSSSPKFPSAQPYGGVSPTADLPNPFDLHKRFDGLTISATCPNIYPQVRRNSEGRNAFGAPSPGAPPSKSRPVPPPPPSIPVPNVLTPGNSEGLHQGERMGSIDYLPPFRNPLPRPPVVIPSPYDYEKAHILHVPTIYHADSAPSSLPDPSSWAGSKYPDGPSISVPPVQGHLDPPPAYTPGRVRATSVPPEREQSVPKPSGNLTQCSGVTKANKRCTRMVKAPPPLGFLNPEEQIPRFCFQHAKEMLAATGFYSSPNNWIEFSEWIPDYLQEGTKVALRTEMEQPISSSDVGGYIYCYELRDSKKPNVINLKVGRAVNLVKRIDEWTKSCESKEPILRGWYPGPDEGDHNGVSLMKGRVMAGRKGKNCHRLERLIHLELADLVVNTPYLSVNFVHEDNSQGSKKASKKKAATPKKVNKTKKGKKGKKDNDDYEESTEEEGEEEEEDSEEESIEVETPRTPQSKAKMPARKPCKDCGAVHKEIFTFTRPKDGPLKGHEWEKLVQPVIWRWGRFVDTHT